LQRCAPGGLAFRCSQDRCSMPERISLHLR
jgi:hypothetical protein